MQWRPAILVDHINFSTAVHQCLHHVRVAHLTGTEQRRVLHQIRAVYLRSVIQQQLNCRGVACHGCRMQS